MCNLTKAESINGRLKNKNLIRILALTMLVSPLTVSADPVSVSYDIGPYIEGGYSASWLHGATGCSGPGPSGGTLYMCGGPVLEIVGSITGELDGGVLTIMGGSLNIGGTDYGVLGGMLGAFPAVDFMWSIVIAGLGTFYFDNIYMGTGLPNHFDGNDLILWGQNWNAYFCAVGTAGCDRWGIDLYGAKSSIPEPGTMGLLGIGLLGLGFSMRRRKT